MKKRLAAIALCAFAALPALDASAAPKPGIVYGGHTKSFSAAN